MVLELAPIPACSTRSQQDLAAQLFPEGASVWGRWALFDATDRLALTTEVLAQEGEAQSETHGTVISEEGERHLRRSKDRVAEVVLELVRRMVAPDAPSRLACVYAYRELAAA